VTLHPHPSSWTADSPFSGGTGSATDDGHARRDWANFVTGVASGGGRVVDSFVPSNVTISTLTLSALQTAATGDPEIGDEVLFASQSTKAENGIYVVTQSGAPCATKIDAQPWGIVVAVHPVFEGEDASASEVSLLRRTADNQYLQLDSRAQALLAEHAADTGLHGGGGVSLAGRYINIVGQLTSGTHAATLATLLSTDSEKPEGFRMYIYDGTNASILISVGETEPMVLDDFQPEVGMMFVSHIFVDQASNLLDQQRIWYVGADTGIAAPHNYVVNGHTRNLGGASATLSLMDVAIVTLTGDRAFDLPSGSFVDETTGWVDILILDNGGFELTLTGTVSGMSDPVISTVGWYRILATGSGLVWAQVPSAPVTSPKLLTRAVSVDTTLDPPEWLKLNTGGLTVTLPSSTADWQFESVIANPNGSACFIDGTVNGVTDPTIPAGKAVRLYAQAGSGNLFQGYLVDLIS